MIRGTGFEPVGSTGILSVVSRATAGRMPACPTARMAVLRFPASFSAEQWEIKTADAGNQNLYTPNE